MKKAFIAIALTLLMCGTALAASESNIFVPGVQLRYGANTQLIATNLILSNITDHEVEVTVELYDQDGDILQGKCRVYKGSNTSKSVSTISTDSNSFTIPPHGTRVFQFYKASGAFNIIGHALISWRIADGTVSRALVGEVRSDTWYNNQFEAWGSVLLNNGNPF